MRRSTLLSTLAVTAATVGAIAVPASSQGVPGVVDLTVPAARETEPVVLTGRDFGVDTKWSVPQNLTFLVPEKDLQCFIEEQDLVCPDEHSQYVEPDVDTAKFTAGKVEGTPTDKLLGYRWDGKSLRADPLPGRRGLHPLPEQQRVGLRHLLGDRPAHDLRLRPRGLPLHGRERRVDATDPCTAQADFGERRRPTR